MSAMLPSSPGFEHITVTDLGVQTHTDEETGEEWSARVLVFTTIVDGTEHGSALTAAPDIKGAMLDALIRLGCGAMHRKMLWQTPIDFEGERVE